MNDPGTPLDALYGQAIRLGDAARREFDDGGAGSTARAALDARERAAVATESLAITARLMELVSWFLRRQAAAAGDGALGEGSRWVLALDVDAVPIPRGLTSAGRGIAEASRRLYREVRAIDG